MNEWQILPTSTSRSTLLILVSLAEVARSKEERCFAVPHWTSHDIARLSDICWVFDALLKYICVLFLDLFIIAGLAFTGCIKVKFFHACYRALGPGADPGVQAVNPQVTLSRLPGGMLPLLSARPVVTSIAFTRWRHLYTVAHIRFQLTIHLSTPKI